MTDQPHKKENRFFSVNQNLSIDQEAIILSSADLMNKVNSSYTYSIDLFLDEIDIECDKKSYLSYRRLIVGNLAQSIMMVIWRESNFLTSEGLGMAGFARAEGEFKNPLNKNLLSNIICRDQNFSCPNKIQSVSKSVIRICEALSAFGLIEYYAEREGLRPIKATSDLHRLMVCCYGEITEIYYNQLNPNHGDLDD